MDQTSDTPVPAWARDGLRGDRRHHPCGRTRTL